MLDKAKFDEIFSAIAETPNPDVLLVGGYQHAIISAAQQFAGRNWRRIKREMRKAGERYWKNRRA